MADELPVWPNRDATQISNAELVSRIASGNTAAEQQLVLRYRRSVLLLAQRLCRGQRSDADDVIQDVFAQVIEHLRAGQLRDPALLPHYLRQAVHHRSTQHYRGHPLHRPAHLADKYELHDPLGSPLQQILKHEGEQTLLRLVRELPQDRDRELLFRFFAKQQDREQICAELQIDPLHFRRVLSRARSRMRELIERTGLRRFEADD